MDAFTQAFLVFSGMIACLTVGYHLGFSLGKRQIMTRTQAARIMAKASWARRDRVQVPYRPLWRRFGGDR